MSYSPLFEINGRKIGPGYPVYTIAELSCNHNQNYDVALDLVRAAHLAGADAVKIQTYRADTITIDCDNDYFKIKGTIWDGEKLYDLYQRAYTPWEWTMDLKKEANKLGMDLFSSPFDVTAVDFLEEIVVPVYKIASFEIVDHVLLKRVARTGKPVIVSTGMASLGDISSAVKCLRDYGSGPIALLKCTSAYPANPADANLRNIENLRDTFGVVTGLSDHTIGPEVPIVSVALGACIVEKHFTFSRDSGSPDDEFSLTPDEFGQMVKSIRIAEKTIGKVTYGGVSSEDDSKQLRRSLFVVEDIKAGEILTPQNLKSIRPGNGLHTRHYDDLLGRIVMKDVERGTPMNWQIVGDLKPFKILFLGENDNPIVDYLKSVGEEVTTLSDKLNPADYDKMQHDFDYVISYGYRHIVKKEFIDRFPDKIINLHISYLPWNRGADPNLWSFINNGPAGVTIHKMDQGLDTGEILVQQRIWFDKLKYNELTLGSTYQQLKDNMIKLFKMNWKLLRSQQIMGKIQNNDDATLHYSKDGKDIINKLPNGWNTTINELYDSLKK